jgi:hypothetical protein
MRGMFVPVVGLALGRLLRAGLVEFNRFRDREKHAIVAETRPSQMKNIYDVMRQKELEIERLKKEIEALRVVAPMLEDKDTVAASPAKTYSATQQNNNEPVIAAETGKAARVWP